MDLGAALREIGPFDSLAHVTPTGRWFATTHDASVCRFRQQLMEYGVSSCIVSETPCLGEERIPEAIELTKGSTRLWRLPLLRCSKDGIEIDGLRDRLKDEDVIGVKLHPRYLGHHFSWQSVDLVADMLVELGKTMFVCSVGIFEAFDESDERNWRALFHRTRNCRVVVLHGGYRRLLEVAELARRYENVLIDLSATLPTFFDSSIGLDVKNLMRRFDRRICVGTDFPEFTYEDVLTSLSAINPNISKDLLAKITRGNLEDFLLC